MGDIVLTDKEVLADIEKFRDRILAAQEGLKNLPGGRIPLKEHRKREAKRKLLQDEIDHVQKLIEIAEEGLSLDFYINQARKTSK